MNTSIFGRLLWKEFRLQRMFWIAMLVLAVMLLVLVYAFVLHPHDRLLWMFWIAVGAPGFYALGCGATLFAGEHDAETYEFQRALPVSAKRLFCAKIVFALLSAPAMLGLTWLLAAFLSDWTFPDAEQQVEIWEMAGFFGLEMFLWATLFSLLMKRTLVVAILGVAAASVSLQTLCCPAYGALALSLENFPWRAALAAVLALLDVGLGFQWFRPQPDRRLELPWPGTNTDMATQPAAISARLDGPQRMVILWRLVWQQWRQSGWLMGLLLIPGAIVSLYFTVLVIAWGVNYRDFTPIDGAFGYFGAAILGLGANLAILSVPLLGLCTFLADQRRASFRFLVERGVAPKYVWWSRQLFTFAVPALLVLVVLLPAIVFTMLFLGPSLMERFSPFSLYTSDWPTLRVAGELAHSYVSGWLFGLAILGYMILGLVVGQLCSMYMRSALLAGFFSVVLTGAFVAWCALMWLFGVNWLWSVLPIPLALLLASRLRTTGWLLERNTFRAWLAPGLALAVPVVAILTAVPLYRIYQVPNVDPGVSAEELAECNRPATPAERATRGLYAQARRPYPNRPKMPSMKARLTNEIARTETDRSARSTKETARTEADRQERIELMLKASRGTLYYAADEQPDTELCKKWALLLVFGAPDLEKEGKLDEALEYYLAALRIAVQCGLYEINSSDSLERKVYAYLPQWAARPNQTPERVLDAMRQIEQLTSGISHRRAIVSAYARARHELEGDPSSLADSMPRGVMKLWPYLPWERARALRLLSVLTRCQLDHLSKADEVTVPSTGVWLTDDQLRWFREDLPELLYTHSLYSRVDPVDVLLAGQRFYAYRTEGRKSTLVRKYAAMEATRRAVRIILALEAWKLQHGSLPEKLDELVGPCLDKLPSDPYSGESFRYYREGLNLPFCSNPTTLYSWWYHEEPESPTANIAAHTPFIWSFGEQVVRREHRTVTEHEQFTWDYYCESDRDGSWRKLRSEAEIVAAGWAFPVP